MSLLKRLKKNHSLAKYSTFSIGGAAKYFIQVHNINELKEAFNFANREGLKTFMLGKGSNSLFDDKGYNGLVILNKIDFCEFKKDCVFVGAGYSFSYLGIQCAKKGFSGLEFASGIPASVGGAIYMNAGANNCETFDVLEKVTYLEKSGKEMKFLKEDFEYGYRSSNFQKLNGAIVSAVFRLSRLDTAKEKQRSIIDYRIKTQPYGEKSAGCVFQNPEKFSAGHLIEEVGLKGFSIGGAKVSEKHANFIINDQGCSAKDVLDLISYIQKVVKEKKGISLKEEVRFIPYEAPDGV